MIKLTLIHHRNADCIFFIGDYRACIDIIRRTNGILYSKTYRAYYIPKAIDNVSELRSTLEKSTTVEVGAGIEDIADLVPSAYRETLERLRYSPHTISNYVSHFGQFLRFILPERLPNISDDSIRRYMNHLIHEKNASNSAQNMAINSIKFYQEKICGQDRKIYYLERPRREHKLPTVLSESEVASLLSRITNLKHQLIVIMLYSSGLRISELLNLTLADVDGTRGIVIIRGGKGNKDRITLLSKKAISKLERYIQTYHPKHFVFEGPHGKRYSARSVDKIIKRAAARAEVTKNVSAHTFRHSFATHLLEHGTDLLYIQTLLGHESSRTTERYTHITKKGLENIISPFDFIENEGNLEE